MSNFLFLILSPSLHIIIYYPNKRQTGFFTYRYISSSFYAEIALRFTRYLMTLNEKKIRNQYSLFFFDDHVDDSEDDDSKSV